MEYRRKDIGLVKPTRGDVDTNADGGRNVPVTDDETDYLCVPPSSGENDWYNTESESRRQMALGEKQTVVKHPSPYGKMPGESDKPDDN